MPPTLSLFPRTLRITRGAPGERHHRALVVTRRPGYQLESDREKRRIVTSAELADDLPLRREPAQVRPRDGHGAAPWKSVRPRRSSPGPRTVCREAPGGRGGRVPAPAPPQ